MPAELIDFDGCGDLDRSLAQTGAWSTAFTTISTTAGQFSGDYGIDVLGGGGSATRIFQDPAGGVYATTYPIVGFGLKLVTQASPGWVAKIQNGSTVHFQVRWTTAGAIEILGPAATVIYTLAAGAFPATAYNYWEIEAIIDNSVGEIRVYCNADPTPLIDLDTLDTRNGTPTNADRIVWTGAAGSESYIDNWYLVDGNVAVTVIGGVRVSAQRVPNSDSSVQFDRSTGSFNYATIDEKPFSTSDYNQTDVDGEIDLYGIADDGIEYQVIAVRTVGQMKKTDASAAQGRLIIKDGANQGNGLTRVLATSSVVYADVFNVRPGGAGDWTQPALDALLIGVERVAV